MLWCGWIRFCIYLSWRPPLLVLDDVQVQKISLPRCNVIHPGLSHTSSPIAFLMVSTTYASIFRSPKCTPNHYPMAYTVATLICPLIISLEVNSHEKIARRWNLSYLRRLAEVSPYIYLHVCIPPLVCIPFQIPGSLCFTMGFFLPESTPFLSQYVWNADSRHERLLLGVLRVGTVPQSPKLAPLS